MNVIDIIILGLLGFGLIKGFIKGLFIEITSLIGLVLGIYGAIHFSYYLSDFLNTKVSWEPVTIQIISFLGTFFIILIALTFLGKLLTKVAQTMALGILNKMLGALFGFAKYVLIVSILLSILLEINQRIELIPKRTINQSSMVEPVKNIAPSLFPNLIKVRKGNEK